MILFCFLSLFSRSQSRCRKTLPVNVTVTVINNFPVQLTTLNNMKIPADIGNDNEIYISPVSSSFAGLLRANGIPDAKVRMSYMINELLWEENGNGTISIQYEMSGNDRWFQESSRLINTGEAVFNIGSNGIYYLWVGGYVNIVEAGVGRYHGKFTLEIEYL